MILIIIQRSREKAIFVNRRAAYKAHEDSLIKQLLSKEGLSQTWSNTILSIAHQIVDHVRPDLHHDADNLDIRQYIQFKKCPGSSRDDCNIVSGVICSKNVAHRCMNAMIAHPKILLLQCGLMYQRVEGKLISLEPVMLQVYDKNFYHIILILFLINQILSLIDLSSIDVYFLVYVFT